ncbi:MAG: lipopolysaccharide export system permease protein [Halioglobus sp.]
MAISKATEVDAPMTLLKRYIAHNLMLGWLVVFLLLAAVFGLIGFIEELERTSGDYTVAAVIYYTLLTLPQKVLGLSPVVALLGTIAALGRLQKSNELLIFSCSGVPLRDLLWAIARPTLLLMALLWLSLEYVAAPLHKAGEELRNTLRSQNSVVIPSGGVWSKSDNRYIHLGKMLPGYTPGDIDLYEFSDDGELTLHLHAKTATVHPKRRWEFNNVRQKRQVDGKLKTSHLHQVEILNLWSRQELPTLTLSSDSMGLALLYRYSKYLESIDRSNQHYRSAFWQRLIMPLTVAAMVLLATPLAASMGSMRSNSFGITLGVGALVGILFYVGAQIVFALGQLLELGIIPITGFPTVVVVLCASALITRMRW